MLYDGTHTGKHTAKKLVPDQETPRSTSTETSTNYPKLSDSNRLTREYPQLIEDVNPPSIQIVISVIHLPPSNNTLSIPCAISYC